MNHKILFTEWNWKIERDSIKLEKHKLWTVILVTQK